MFPHPPLPSLCTAPEKFPEKRSLFGLSPWLIVGLSLILASIVIVLALRSTERGRARITENFLDRADSLIGALEACTKAGIDLGEDARLVQPFVVEMARQRGIVYVGIVDAEGRVLAHSDPQQVGKILPRERLPAAQPPSMITWHELHSADSGVYEVYREFVPAPGYHHNPAQAHGAMVKHTHAPSTDDRHSQTDAPEEHVPPSFALIGFDKRPYEEDYASDRFSSIMTALVAAALGLGSFFSLFWAHNSQRTRRLLKDSQALAAKVVSSLPVGLITCDPDGNIGMLNAVALNMLQQKHSPGMPLHTLHGLNWQEITVRLQGGEKVLEQEMPFHTSGGVTSVSVSASVIRNEEGLFLGHLFILRDISEMKRLQAEARRNDRLAVLGNLAAGVAHEVRNPLSSIKGLATFLAERLRPGALEEEAAKTLISEVDRLNRVVSQLLDFAKPGVLKMAATDMNAVLSHALRLVDADLRAKDIQVTFTPDQTLPPVPANAERLTQALLNLLLNAVQAMEPGGRLHLALQRHEQDKELHIHLTDDGCGMSPETQLSMFTPYFTTKKSGTGLGLSIVQQIAEGHGGRVEVRSVARAGSTFTLVIPLLIV